MLIKVGDDFGIMYATHIPSRGFQRFSISHELGHYFIEGHPEALLTTGVHQSRAGFVSGDPFEQEADYFAAALLMPELPFKKAIADRDPGLACVESLCTVCETSLTACHPLQLSHVRRHRSPFQHRRYDRLVLHVRRPQAGKRPELGSKRHPRAGRNGYGPIQLGARQCDDGQREAGEGRLNDWLGGDRPYRVTEEVVGLGQYGRTLTILACKNLSLRAEAEDPEDDEDALIESWTPRFRR
jgi:hypothetical protein